MFVRFRWSAAARKWCQVVLGLVKAGNVCAASGQWSDGEPRRVVRNLYFAHGEARARSNPACGEVLQARTGRH